MNGIKRVVTIIILLLAVGMVGSMGVSADDNGMPFTVEPVLTENQDKDIQSYITEKLKGTDYKQSYQFRLTNSSDTEQEVAVTVVDAYTSPNGVVQYVEEESDNSKITDNKYKMSKYLTVNDGVVKLNPGQTKTIELDLDVEDIEGTLLGGVSFKTLEDGEEVEDGESSFKINNEINMVVGVMLEFDTEQEVGFEIKEPFLDPMPSYYAVRLPIELKSSFLVKDTELEYDVSFKGEDLFGGMEKISFAPKTEANISLPFDYEEIKENEDYVIKGTFTYKDSEDKKQTIDFEEVFVYENNESTVDKVSKTLTTPVVGTGIALYWYLIGLVVLVGLGFYLYKRNKKGKKTSEDIEE